MENAERTCSECGEPIPTARLREKPNTTLCVGCKTKLEMQPRPKTREKAEKVKQRKSRLPEPLEKAILTLSPSKEIRIDWQADADSDVTDALAKAEAHVERFTTALAAKHLFDGVQLVKIRAALRQASNEIASIVSNAMNADAKTIRQALKCVPCFPKLASSNHATRMRRSHAAAPARFPRDERYRKSQVSEIIAREPIRPTSSSANGREKILCAARVQFARRRCERVHVTNDES